MSVDLAEFEHMLEENPAFRKAGELIADYANAKGGHAFVVIKTCLGPFFGVAALGTIEEAAAAAGVTREEAQAIMDEIAEKLGRAFWTVPEIKSILTGEPPH